MGVRRIRRKLRQIDMARSRLVNGIRKVSERDRRDKRMLKIIKNGKLPFLPSVMTWISEKLDKPSRLITQDEVDTLTK